MKNRRPYNRVGGLILWSGFKKKTVWGTVFSREPFVIRGGILANLQKGLEQVQLEL